MPVRPLLSVTSSESPSPHCLSRPLSPPQSTPDVLLMHVHVPFPSSVARLIRTTTEWEPHSSFSAPGGPCPLAWYLAHIVAHRSGWGAQVTLGTSPHFHVTLARGCDTGSVGHCRGMVSRSAKCNFKSLFSSAPHLLDWVSPCFYFVNEKGED